MKSYPSAADSTLPSTSKRKRDSEIKQEIPDEGIKEEGKHKKKVKQEVEVKEEPEDDGKQ